VKVLLGALIAAAAVATTGAAADVPARYSYPVWSPDGKRIAFLSNRHDPATGYDDVYVGLADGSGVTRVTREALGKAGLSWSRDGTRFAYQAYAYIETVRTDGSDEHRLTAEGGFAPAWSPGRRKLAYARGDETTGSSIYVMNVDGSHKQLVAAKHGDQSFGSPAWSPDGQRLAFTSGTAADSPIQTPFVGIVDRYRGRIARYAVGHAVTCIDWSPDGRRLLLVEDPKVNDPAGAFRLAILDLKTRRLRSLGVPAHSTARWSPNGRRILFEDQGAIFAINADGSHRRRLLGSAS
jgi:Tol biopolymer transport system component